MHDVVPGAGERISYGMPTFLLDGQPLVHVAAWKKHIALYPLPAADGDVGLENALAPFRGTPSTLRLPLADPIPYELVGRVVTAPAAQRRIEERGSLGRLGPVGVRGAHRRRVGGMTGTSGGMVGRDRPAATTPRLPSGTS